MASGLFNQLRKVEKERNQKICEFLFHRTSGLPQLIEYYGSASLVCCVGSWDGYSKVVPLGFDHSTDLHSLRLILAKGSHYFRFVVVNGSDIVECTSNHSLWPIEIDDNGIQSHVIKVNSI